MRTLKLTEETQSELLGNLLNRNPGSYAECENIVNDIIDNVEKTAIRMFLNIHLSLIRVSSALLPSGLQKMRSRLLTKSLIPSSLKL